MIKQLFSPGCFKKARGFNWLEVFSRYFLAGGLVNRLPNFSDLVCYWFERARAKIAAGEVQRVGLLATNSIRGGRFLTRAAGL